MRETEIVNARITSTEFGEPEGILTCWLHLEGEGWGQGFGGFALDSANGKRDCGDRIRTAYGLEFLVQTMRAVGVKRWEDLKGQFVRAERRHSGGPIIGIGHIIKEQWFYPEDLNKDQVSRCGLME